MKHAREDYNRIQDPTGLIPEDEPVFIIRGQDIVGPKAVRYWAMRAAEKGANENIIIAAFRQAKAMEKWQQERASKIPDMPS